LVLSPPHLTMSEFFARTIQSKKMMEEAEQVLPNGVTANIKFFDPYPIVMKFGNGPYLTDVDGNLYIDYLLSYGALMCGHGHPRIKEAIIKQMEKDGTNLFGTPHEMETSLGKRIQSYYPSMERIRYTNSGTEGTLLAIRLASSFTGKSAIAKFEGHSMAAMIRCFSALIPIGMKWARIGNLMQYRSRKGSIPFIRRTW